MKKATISFLVLSAQVRKPGLRDAKGYVQDTQLVRCEAWTGTQAQLAKRSVIMSRLHCLQWRRLRIQIKPWSLL